MKSLILLLPSLVASLTPAVLHRDATNTTETASNVTDLDATRWPRVPFGTRLTSPGGANFGILTIHELGPSVADRRQREPLASLMNNVVKDVEPSENAVAGYVVSSRTLRPIWFGLEDRAFEGQTIPRQFLGTIIAQVERLIRQHDIRNIVAEIQAPFGVGAFILKEGGTSLRPTKTPVYVSAGFKEDAIVTKVTNLGQDPPDRSDEARQEFLHRCMEVYRRLGALNRQAPFIGVREDFEYGGVKFHIVIEPVEPGEYTDPLTNEKAWKAWSQWQVFFAAKVAGDFRAMDFEIKATELYTAEVVAKGRFYWDGAAALESGKSTPTNMTVPDNRGSAELVETVRNQFGTKSASLVEVS